MAFLLVLGSWVAAAFVLIGLGAVVCRRVFGFRPERAAFAVWFWTGFLSTVAVGLLVHFVAPVNGWLWLPLAAVALWGWRSEQILHSAPLAGMRPSMRYLSSVLSLIWIALCVLAAMRPTVAVDNGLYFIQTVQWFEHFRVVPGLAALHPCLGHNQTYFLWVSSFGLGPFVDRPWVLSNGLLLVAAGLPGIVSTAGLVLGGPTSRSPGGLLTAILLGPLLDAILGPTVSSPVADTAVLACGAAGLAWLSEALVGGTSLQEARWMLVLAAFATTLKQPFVCITGPLVLFSVVRPLCELKRLLPAIAGTAALVFVWMAHGVILSGYPFYPLPLLGLPVDWRVPPKVLRALTEYTFATHEWGAPSFRFGAMKSHWAAGWFQKRLTQNRLFLIPAVGFAISWISLVTRRARVDVRPAVAYLLLTSFGVLVWWNMLPDERFAGALLWGAGFGAWGLLFGTHELASRLGWLILVALVLLGGLWPLPRVSVSNELPAVPRGNELPLELSSGDVILQAGPDGLCFQMPCAFQPYPSLELRSPGNLSAGFRRPEAGPYLP